MPRPAKRSSASRRDVVVVDLQGGKDRWLAWCQSMQLTPSEAFRELVGRLEPGTLPDLTPKTAKDPRAAERFSARPKVPLTEEEWTRIAALAAEDEISVPRWIVSLVHAHLTGEPQLCWPEVARLNTLIVQLSRIGSNLNTTTKKVNELVADRDRTKRAGGRVDSGEKALAELAELRRERIESLFTQLSHEVASAAAGVRIALEANAKRWTAKVRTAKDKSGGAGPFAA